VSFVARAGNQAVYAVLVLSEAFGLERMVVTVVHSEARDHDVWLPCNHISREAAVGVGPPRMVVFFTGARNRPTRRPADIPLMADDSQVMVASIRPIFRSVSRGVCRIDIVPLARMAAQSAEIVELTS
jgi:hypothetical protein